MLETPTGWVLPPAVAGTPAQAPIAAEPKATSMSGDCRRAPIGKKYARVTQVPEDAPQLGLINLFVEASQDGAWRGTLVDCDLDCPGMLTNKSGRILDGVRTRFINVAANVSGRYRGTARFSWPNGERKTVNWFYTIVD